MGHREDLLVGAKRCLIDKGYTRTTARDIVAASGANLASIGYHFGSKEALLNAAFIQAVEEWGVEFGRAMAEAVSSDAGPIERFDATWSRIFESFSVHRKLWAAKFEILTQIDSLPDVRKVLIEATERTRPALAALFQGIDPETDEEAAWVVGSFYQVLLTGVMVQWLVDPSAAPSGKDIIAALRLILSGLPQHVQA